MQPLQPKKMSTKKKINVQKKINIYTFDKNKDQSLLTPTCIGATIRIGREIQCLPYAEFFFSEKV